VPHERRHLFLSHERSASSLELLELLEIIANVCFESDNDEGLVAIVQFQLGTLERHTHRERALGLDPSKGPDGTRDQHTHRVLRFSSDAALSTL